jgi:PAS domain S-box-containing protein
LAERTSELILVNDQLRREIEERSRAEEALRESEEKYRSMMEAMIEPIYICSPDFRVEHMNPTMIRRTGRDATGEHCFKVLHDLEEKCPWCTQYKSQQGEPYELEIVSPKDNRSYHVSSSPIVHGDGTISKMTVFSDITDKKLADERIKA